MYFNALTTQAQPDHQALPAYPIYQCECRTVKPKLDACRAGERRLHHHQPSRRFISYYYGESYSKPLVQGQWASAT